MEKNIQLSNILQFVFGNFHFKSNMFDDLSRSLQRTLPAPNQSTSNSRCRRPPLSVSSDAVRSFGARQNPPQETCWCSAGNEGITPTNHPLSFPLIPRFTPSFPAEQQQDNATRSSSREVRIRVTFVLQSILGWNPPPKKETLKGHQLLDSVQIPGPQSEVGEASVKSAKRHRGTRIALRQWNVQIVSLGTQDLHNTTWDQ